MSKRSLFFGIVVHSIVFIGFCMDSVARSADYLDPDPPGNEPKPFAVELLKQYGQFLQGIDVSTDLRHYYSQATDSDWVQSRIVELTIGDDGDVKLQTLAGTDRNNYKKACSEPCISVDGHRLFFSSSGGVWVMDRDGADWRAPVKLGPSIDRPGWREGCPSISDNGTIYFHSFERTPYENAVFRSRFEAGHFTRRVRLDVLSEDGDAGDPGIAPDESLIVFASSRPGGRGYTDLYVSSSREGRWTKPRHLGDAINTEAWELGPKFSPDGKYLFFYRRDKIKSATYSRIYWVSTSALRSAQ